MICERGCLHIVSHRLSLDPDEGRGKTNLLGRHQGRRSRCIPAQSCSQQAARAAYLSSATGHLTTANRGTPAGTRVSRLGRKRVSGGRPQAKKYAGRGGQGDEPKTSMFFSGNRFPLATEPSIDVQRFFCSPLRPSVPVDVEV